MLFNLHNDPNPVSIIQVHVRNAWFKLTLAQLKAVAKYFKTTEVKKEDGLFSTIWKMGKSLAKPAPTNETLLTWTSIRFRLGVQDQLELLMKLDEGLDILEKEDVTDVSLPIYARSVYLASPWIAPTNIPEASFP